MQILGVFCTAYGYFFPPSGAFPVDWVVSFRPGRVVAVSENVVFGGGE